MTERIPQSTAKLVVFKAYLASDHVSEATGKTIAITISKNGGAFGNPAAGALNATEISSGWYKASLGTGDTDTLGPLAIRGAVATIDDVGVLIEVVSATSGGYTNLDAAVSAVKAKTDSLTFTVANQIDANVIDWKGATAPAMTGDAFARLGAPVGASVSADIAALPTANANADALLDRSNGVETGLTPRGALRLAAAAMAGKVSGGGTGTETFRNAVADSKNRIVSTNDSSGNRTAVTTDVT